LTVVVVVVLDWIEGGALWGNKGCYCKGSVVFVKPKKSNARRGQ
jgi:hypothetical protein